MKLFLTLLLFLFSTQLAFSDTPPQWRANFSIKSENAKYEAEVEAADESKASYPQLKKYILTVFEIKEGQRLPLWSSDYKYDGYSDGVLSNDGLTFVYVNFWYYSELPVVTIYHKGTKREILGKDFEIQPAKIKQTVSHQLWLKEDGKQYRFVSNDSLMMLTIDNNQYLIDVTTGKISKGQ